MGSFSCKEKKRAGSDFFTSEPSSEIAADSLNLENDLGIELNINPDPNRGTWQNPALIIRKMGPLTDKIVADIGSGTGYFTMPIARLAKRVIAIDIEQRYLDYIEDYKLELPVEEADRIETRLTVAYEPNLHADEVDVVLMVNVFYYLTNRPEYMKIVRDAIRKEGILVLVDFKPGESPVGPADNKVPTAEVVSILENAGFEKIAVDSSSLTYQYIVTAH
jgi:SAM-dependent methyltransferase